MRPHVYLTVGLSPLLMVSLAGCATTQPAPAIVPQPAQMRVSRGAFELGPRTCLVAGPGNADVRAVAELLATYVREQTGFALDLADEGGSAIVLDTHGADSSLGEEGYELAVTPERIVLRAPQAHGLFYGVQTIRQLLPPGPQSGGARQRVEIPCLRITDRPRYRWRGMLLDCCRHFMTKEFVKRYIDLLAYHKMNVLHWHLTEDQGWRIEIKKYPRLTTVGAWRGDEHYGGFYTQDDIREVVEYARQRYVMVVPEIEMPGHSLAALVAYPELSCTGGPFSVGTRWGVYQDVYCAGNDRVFDFLDGVLSEVMKLFPSPYIHIGGDECPKDRWRACPKCQARIAAEGLKDEHELQSYFVRRIERFLNSHGRRIIGWDEILEGGLAPNATVQSWRGMDGAIAAANAGHDVISSPTSHCYLDYAQVRSPGEPTQMGFIDLQTAYSFEPTPAQLTPEQAKHVLGLEGNIWTEHAPQERVDWQVFPRLCALAEVAWSPKTMRDWDDFEKRLHTHYSRLDALGVQYFLEPPRCLPPERVFSTALTANLTNPLQHGVVRYTLDGTDPTERSSLYRTPIHLRQSAVLKAQTFLPDGRCSAVAVYRFRRMQPLDPVVVSNARPGLAFAYYEGEWSKLPDFDELAPVATGTVEHIDLNRRQREELYGLRFTGFISVPRDGTYTFHLTSDDGSRLWIGSDLIADNDGLHGSSTQTGQVILKAGLHPIRVEFFQAGGARQLDLSYEGPGIARQLIPATDLWHRWGKATAER